MYTFQRFAAVLFGAAIACAAGAQPAPDDRGPPDARYQQSSDQGPAYDAEAGDQNAAGQSLDPPARVARLSHLNGAVSFTPAGENDWVEAQLNRPLVTGDKLWTNGGGRAELQVGSASVALDHDTSFDFLNLDDQLAQMELTQGVLRLDVRRVRGSESYEVDTPTIAFIADRAGEFRIDVHPQGATIVTALRGDGEAVGEGGKRVTIEQGQSVTFNDSQLVDYTVDRLAPPDDFDRYCQQREQRYTRANPRGYVSTDVTGYEDLDEYGSWDDSPDYGHVWYPREVAVDWAPYHDGEWEWIDPWGWTWVDNAPWGFAPFHYGRWAYIDSRWGWVPGPLDVEPVYAPALVAFVGGGGFGVDISVGGPIGWFALGPSDVYFPGYRCGRDYFTRVNIGNAYVQTTVVNNYYGDWSRGRLDYSQIRYANRNMPSAMIAMNGSAFVAGRPVRSAAIAVNQTTFANARVMPRPGLTPTRASLFASRGRAAAPPQSAFRQTVVAAHQPAPPRPSFAQRQAVLQRNGGQPLTVSQLHSLSARSTGNARAGLASNVRVVGNGRDNARGPVATAQNRAAVNAGRERGNAGVAPDTRRMDNRATVSADGRRNVEGSPSRAPQMNRSPERANAQYMRSAGFAHHGVVPGSERALNARGRVNARGRSEDIARAQDRMPAQRGRETGAQAAANARLNSSRFAHGENPDTRALSQAGGRERASAMRQQEQRGQGAARNDALARDRASAMRQQQQRSQASARNESLARERANATRQQEQRSQASTRNEAMARERASAMRQQEQRSQASARTEAMARERASAMRQQEQRSQASARNEAMARERASAMRQQEQRSQASARNEAMARERASAMRQQEQRSQAARSEAAARENAMRQQAESRARAEASRPPPQPQSRPAPQQRQMARSAPQQGNAPRDRKKRDQNNGG